MGLVKGDVIYIYARNYIDTFALTWGTIWAECVVSPANSDYSAFEFASQLKDLDSKALIAQVSLLEIAFAAAKLARISQSCVLAMREEKCGQALHFTDSYYRQRAYQTKLAWYNRHLIWPFMLFFRYFRYVLL